MGRKPEQTFFQGGNADGQQVHENMLNVINHQQNANQNHNEILPHICQNGFHQMDNKLQVLASMRGKKNPCVLSVVL